MLVVLILLMLVVVVVTVIEGFVVVIVFWGLLLRWLRSMQVLGLLPYSIICPL